MQPQLDLIDVKVDDLVNSCQEDVEFRLPKLTWVKYMNDALIDLYDVLFIEADATLTRPEGQSYFELPKDFKQLYMVGDTTKEYQYFDVGSSKDYDYVFANATSSGTYNIFNGKLTVTGYEQTILPIKYFRKPQFLKGNVTDERVDVPNEYIEAIRLYACAKAMLAEDETERYQSFMSLYNTKKSQLRSYANRYRPERELYWKVRR